MTIIQRQPLMSWLGLSLLRPTLSNPEPRSAGIKKDPEDALQDKLLAAVADANLGRMFRHLDERGLPVEYDPSFVRAIIRRARWQLIRQESSVALSLEDDAKGNLIDETQQRFRQLRDRLGLQDTTGVRKAPFFLGLPSEDAEDTLVIRCRKRILERVREKIELSSTELRLARSFEQGVSDYPSAKANLTQLLLCASQIQARNRISDCWRPGFLAVTIGTLLRVIVKREHEARFSLLQEILETSPAGRHQMGRTQTPLADYYPKLLEKGLVTPVTSQSTASSAVGKGDWSSINPPFSRDAAEVARFRKLASDRVISARERALRDLLRSIDEQMLQVVRDIQTNGAADVSGVQCKHSDRQLREAMDDQPEDLTVEGRFDAAGLLRTLHQRLILSLAQAPPNSDLNESRRCLVREAESVFNRKLPLEMVRWQAFEAVCDLLAHAGGSEELGAVGRREHASA